MIHQHSSFVLTDYSKFQKILVLSKGPSWRTRGLTAAAEHTGLDLEIPVQTLPTEEMIAAFRAIGPENVKHPLRGEAFNWLAHLDLVKYIVAQDLETALVLEDDVDWDISLRHQMHLISVAVRDFTDTPEDDLAPYGHAWDILWIGHCGERINKDTRRLEFPDPTVPLPGNYTGWAKKYMDAIAPGRRAVHRSINPVCSFGYGMTRRGAQKVLRWAGKGENEAYDIRLLEGCKGKALSCITVTPEIMHHYSPPREFGHVSNVADVNGQGSAAEEEEFEFVMGNTANIVNSTRCHVLFNSTCQRKP